MSASHDFDQETALAITFKRVCSVLDIDRTDPLRAVAARKVIELIATGERDAFTLYERTLNEILPAE